MPEDVTVKPALRAAEAREDGKHALRRRRGLPLATIDHHALRDTHEFTRQRAHIERIEPGRRRTGGERAVKRELQRFVVSHGRDPGEVAARRVVLHDHFVMQPVDQRSRDRRRNRGDEMHPIRREPRREERNDDHPAVQTAHFRILQHQVAVGQNVGAADLVGRRIVAGPLQGGDEIRDHVAVPDRLDARDDPLRRDHHGQAFGQIANHLEGDAAGTNDDGRAKFDDGDTARA